MLPLLGMYITQINKPDAWVPKYEVMNREVQLMDLMANTYDIGIFKAKKVLDVLEYKW